jgi:hypothetical protein
MGKHFYNQRYYWRFKTRIIIIISLKNRISDNNRIAHLVVKKEIGDVTYGEEHTDQTIKTHFLLDMLIEECRKRQRQQGLEVYTNYK